MIAGAVTGVAANLTMGDSPALQAFVNTVSYPAGQIFLRLIFMVVIPLVVSALTLGVAELGDVRRLGRVGVKTLAFTLVLSSVSVLIGVGLANLVKPGERLSAKSRAALMEIMGKTAGEVEKPPERETGLQIFLDLIPQNPVEAMVNAFRGDILAVMVFSLFLGVALTLVDRSKTEPLLVWLQALFEVVMKVIDIAMRLAPYGVAALLFTLMARSGLDVLAKLGLYMVTVLVGLVIHQFVTYTLMLKISVKYPPVLFLAQFFGIHLSLGSQITVVLLSILAGIGTAGVPGGSLPLVMALLVTVGVPAEGIGIILGVDRILDMCRTVLNVTGDMTTAAYVAKSEGYTLKS